MIGGTTPETIIDDPVMYTKPWNNKRVYTRMKPGRELIECSCEENNKDYTEGSLPIQIDADKGRFPEEDAAEESTLYLSVLAGGRFAGAIRRTNCAD